MDKETGLMIDVDELRRQFIRHEELLLFFENVESGLITISLSEYTNLPASLAPAWRVYKNSIKRYKKQNPNG